jgi:hypothetical protein
VAARGGGIEQIGLAASKALFASTNTLRWPANREDLRRYRELAQTELDGERFEAALAEDLLK